MKTKELQPIDHVSTNLFDRFQNKGILQDDDSTTFIETYVFPDIPYTNEDIYHTVSSGETGRLDLISFRYYGTPLLDWVIMLANPDLAHPIKDIIPGLMLRIPPQDRVYVNLLGQR